MLDEVHSHMQLTLQHHSHTVVVDQKWRMPAKEEMKQMCSRSVKHRKLIVEEESLLLHTALAHGVMDQGHIKPLRTFVFHISQFSDKFIK